MNNSASGNYPLGAANDPSAPWNELETDPEEYDVTAFFTLNKFFVVTADTSNEEDIRHELINNNMTPLDLINELKGRLEEELKLDPTDKKVQNLIKECEGWEQMLEICLD